MLISFKVIMKILELPGPKFTHPLMMKLFKRGTVKSAHGHGIGRHSQEEVKKIGMADLKVGGNIRFLNKCTSNNCTVPLFGCRVSGWLHLFGAE